MYLSDRTLAKRYDVSRSTIWRWSSEGMLPDPVKINGSTRWKASAIEEWEKAQEQAPRDTSRVDRLKDRKEEKSAMVKIDRLKDDMEIKRLASS